MSFVFLSNKNLTKFPDNLPEDITHLYLNNNQIEEIPDNLPETLIFLFLHNNKITKIPENIFNDVNSYRIIYLNNNKITKIPDKLIDDNKFYNHGYHLDLSDNPIDYTLQKFNLKWINFPKNIKFFNIEKEIYTYVKQQTKILNNLVEEKYLIQKISNFLY